MGFTNAEEKLNAAKSRAQLAIFFLLGSIVLGGVTIFSDFEELSLLRQVLDGIRISKTEADDIDYRQGVIGVVQLTLFFITAVMFLRWLYRAYDNLTVLGVKDKKFTPGWAVGYYFFPLINLVR